MIIEVFKFCKSRRGCFFIEFMYFMNGRKEIVFFSKLIKFLLREYVLIKCFLV